jgi:hypothetical protein
MEPKWAQLDHGPARYSRHRFTATKRMKPTTRLKKRDTKATLSRIASLRSDALTQSRAKGTKHEDRLQLYGYIAGLDAARRIIMPSEPSLHDIRF